jgi:hypothetical protein
MKVKVSFELDLTNNDSLNVRTVEDLRGSLQNLSSYIYNLHLDNLQRTLKAMADKNANPIVKEAMIKAYTQDQEVSEGLFNNYTVEGTTEDGHKFESNHQEPGYKETMIIDGVIETNY